jgi:hypothetical protein
MWTVTNRQNERPVTAMTCFLPMELVKVFTSQLISTIPRFLFGSLQQNAKGGNPTRLLQIADHHSSFFRSGRNI